jgi:hypothetical protein
VVERSARALQVLCIVLACIGKGIDRARFSVEPVFTSAAGYQSSEDCSSRTWTRT